MPAPHFRYQDITAIAGSPRVEAIAQIGIYGFAGRGPTREAAKVDLLQRIRDHLVMIDRALNGIETGPRDGMNGRRGGVLMQDSKNPPQD